MLVDEFAHRHARVVTDDEEIERAIRRDPRFFVRLIVFVVVMVAFIAVGIVSIGRLRLGDRVARGFAMITELPPPDAGTGDAKPLAPAPP